VTIKGKSYDGNVTFHIVVNKKVIASAGITNCDFHEDGYHIFAYTGDVITPEFSLGGLSADDYDVYYVPAVDADGNTINYITSTGSYTETQFSSDNAVELKDTGLYNVVFKLKDNVTNYAIKLTNTPQILVSSEQVFLDVPNGEWYTSYIYKANKQGYVYGYNNSKFYGPNDAIKRGDVVVILARMAGFTKVTAEDETNDLRGYMNKFDDVDDGTYYAKAIAWASKVGIVTGTSETTFEPERNVTREEFVTMLQRYANLCENGKAVAESTATELTKYTDGTTVCDWAKDAVAWASEKNIMTGYAGTTVPVLDPEGAVTRAQVAKMAITYQPEGADSVYATLQ
jgi:hypothetical protein